MRRRVYECFLLKELIIRRFEAAYSTFLLNAFIIRRLRIDYSPLLLKKFIDRRLIKTINTGKIMMFDDLTQ